MRTRRFPRKPIDPMFKVAMAFDLPIDIVIGLEWKSTTYWAMKKTGVIETNIPTPSIPEFFHGDWIES